MLSLVQATSAELHSDILYIEYDDTTIQGIGCLYVLSSDENKQNTILNSDGIPITETNNKIGFY